MSPIIYGGENGTGDVIHDSNVTVGNCMYNSPVQFLAGYWLKDGVRIFNVTIAEQIPTTYDARSHLPQFKVGELRIDRSKVTDQGYYQCAIESRGKKFLSKKVYLKLKGNVYSLS